MLVGQSSGAAFWAALQVARTLEQGDIVTIFPDFGDKDLSTNLWLGWQQRAPRADDLGSAHAASNPDLRLA